MIAGSSALQLEKDSKLFFDVRAASFDPFIGSPPSFIFADTGHRALADYAWFDEMPVFDRDQRI
jgi:hypothetical protein